MRFFDRIIDAIDSFKDSTEKRRLLKEIEQQAYAKQLEVENEIKWQEAVQKAEERGVRNAKMTPAERMKADIAERREKVKEYKAKKVVERAIKAEIGGSHMSQSMKGVIGATAQKRNTSTAIVGTNTTKSTGSVAIGNSKKTVSLVKK
jgi:hypothetical protein